METFCPSCGKESPTDADYCSSCGGELPTSQDERDVQESSQNAHPSNRGQPLEEEELSRLDRFSDGRILLILICAGTAISAFLPWYSATALGSTVSIAGVKIDGLYTFVAALFILNNVFVWWTAQMRQIAVVVGALIAIVGLVSMNDPSGVEATYAIETGIGLPLTILGGLGIALCAFLMEEPGTEEARNHHAR